jgi:hypothetical protein
MTAARILFFFVYFLCCHNGFSQHMQLYPPFTKWYQDPLGLKPLGLSSAAGFGWASLTSAAYFILSKKDTAFQKQLLLYQESGLGFGYKPPYTRTFQSNIGFMYRQRKRISLGFELNSFHFSDGINNTWSFGMRPFARWYFVDHKRIKLFFEYGAGVTFGLERFPLTGTDLKWDTARTGTKFNFSTKYGVGGEYIIAKRLHIQAGLRHFHISNGNIRGIARNPSHDSNGFFVGLLYPFKSLPF